MRINILPIGFLFSLILLLSACGGSGDSSGSAGSGGVTYSGETSQATVDENNAAQLASGTTEGVSSGNNEDELGTLFEEVFTNLSNQKATFTAQAVASGSCGGSATYPDITGDESPITGTISFSSYCIDGGVDVGQVVVSGSVSFEITVVNNELVSMDMTISNLTVTHDGNSVTLNASVAYSNNSVEFSSTTDFVASDGSTYRVENLEVSGSPETGVTITSGRIYHPEQGYVDISTDAPLVYAGCDNGKPSSGTLVLQGSGGSTANVIYNSCTEYQVCANGSTTCQTYTW